MLRSANAMARKAVELPCIVSIEDGVGGLQAAFGLKNARAEMTLIDRNNYHACQQPVRSTNMTSDDCKEV